MKKSEIKIVLYIIIFALLVILPIIILIILSFIDWGLSYEINTIISFGCLVLLFVTYQLEIYPVSMISKKMRTKIKEIDKKIIEGEKNENYK